MVRGRKIGDGASRKANATMRDRMTSVRTELSFTPLRVMLAVVLGAAGSVAMSTSCKTNDGGDSEGGAATDTPPTTCTCSGQFLYARCTCTNNAKRETCQTEAGCSVWCTDQQSSSIKADGNDPDNVPDGWEPISCYNNTDEGSCGSWSPSSNISLVSGVYHVDIDFLTGVVEDPSPLWSCDDALLDDVNGGGFAVDRASSGELLYQLGLRNGDVPTSLNGMPLLTVQDGFDVFTAKWQTGVTSYTLAVTRGGSTVTLSYVLD